MITLDMTIDAALIRSLRDQRAWSQEQLAAIAGLSARTIQRLEADGNASRESRMALAAAFGVEPGHLLPGASAAAVVDAGAHGAGAAGAGDVRDGGEAGSGFGSGPGPGPGPGPGDGTSGSGSGHGMSGGGAPHDGMPHDGRPHDRAPHDGPEDRMVKTALLVLLAILMVVWFGYTVGRDMAHRDNARDAACAAGATDCAAGERAAPARAP